MEEVDSIIVETLREIGCELDDDIKLKSLSPEEIYQSISRLCKTIRPETEMPKALPAQMAQRFAAASQLVDCCKNIGFNGDLGYQTILYSNINELRRVFMWLIEHLPKSEDKTDDSFQANRTVSKAKSIENEIAKKLAIDLKKPWLLAFLQKPSTVKFSPVELEKPSISKQKIDDSVTDYEKNYQLPIFHQTRNLIPSIIHTHDIDLMKKRISSSESTEISKKLRSSMIKPSNLMPSSSRSTLSSHSNLTLADKHMEISQDHQEQQQVPIIPKTQLEILSERVEQLKEQADEQEEIYRQLTYDRNEQIKNTEVEKINLEKSRKEGKLKMQIAMLLDNPEESIEKLQQTLEVAAQKRQNLNAKFEGHKIPLEQHLQSFSSTNSTKLQKIKEARESAQNIKKTILEIHADIKHKIQLQQHLVGELNKTKRTTERSAYTSRIADIINSIKKQNHDINEVLKDTRALQKSINTIEGQLQRQFTVTEELVWTKVR